MKEQTTIVATGRTRIPRIGCVPWPNSGQTRQICRINIPAKGYLKETYKSQNINPISPTPVYLSLIMAFSDKLSDIIVLEKWEVYSTKKVQ